MARIRKMCFGVILAIVPLLILAQNGWASRRSLFLSLDDFNPPLHIPFEPGTPVIEFTERLPWKAHQGPEPDLTVYADGTVVVRFGFEWRFLCTKYGWVRRRPGRLVSKISTQELQKLLHFILVENHLESWNPERAQAEVEQLRAQQTGDTGEAYIRNTIPYELCVKVRVGGELRTVEWRDWFEIFFLLDGRELQVQGLIEVREKLERMRDVILAGGHGAIEKWVALVNETLRTEHPDVSPLGSNDLSSADFLSPDRLSVSFARIDIAEADEGGVLVEVVAKVLIEEGERPAVEVELRRHRY
jgi:hypothetical protein